MAAMSQLAAESIGGWPIDKPFPSLLGDAELMQVIGLKPARFYVLKKRGNFRRLEARPQITGTTRYSGHLVQQWVRGEWTDARTFGKRR